MSTPAQTPEGVQDPSAPEVTPDPPAAAGPWAKDLTTHFPDPAEAARVDAFLRSTVQPYSTQLEQKLAEAGPAQQLYSDLLADPAGTYSTLTEELFGEDGRKAVEEQLTNLFGEEPEETPTVTEPTNTAPPLDPADKDAIEWAKQQATQQAYNAELERVKGLDEYKDVPPEDWDLFHPFVASANGDFDAAAKGFGQWRAQVQERYAPPAVEPDPADPAPPTLGTDSAQTTPPVAKQYTNIDDAIEDFFAESRPAAPPVVGSV